MIIVNENTQTGIDLLPLIFLVLAVVGAVLAIIALIVGRGKNNSARSTVIGLSVLTFFFFVGTIPVGIIGITDPYIYIVDPYIHEFRTHHNACSWVALGLGTFAILFGTLAFVFQLINKNAPSEELVGSAEEQIIIPGQKTVVFTAASNNGMGLWTSICAAFAAIFGVESKNVSKKCKRTLARVRKQLITMMEKHPEYEYSDFRIVKDGNVAYTGTVFGVLKK